MARSVKIKYKKHPIHGFYQSLPEQVVHMCKCDMESLFYFICGKLTEHIQNPLIH